MFSGKACDGLCGLSTFNGFLNTIKGFNRPCTFVRHTASKCLTVSALQEVSWSSGQVAIYPPVPAFGSIWVVLWLLIFRSAPSTFPQRRGYLLGACFRESLVIRLHSEISLASWDAHSVLTGNLGDWSTLY